jgi:AcrR family transcriptional regulator
VLQRVRDVFIEKGFAGASLDELSEAAGLNRPSLYAAFGDKEQLYIHTLRHYGMHGVAGIDAIFAARARSTNAWARSSRARSTSTPPRPPARLHDRRHRRRRGADPAQDRGRRHELLQATEKPSSAPSRAPSPRRAGGEPPPAAAPAWPAPRCDTLAIRARLGTKPAELRAYAASLIPVICR